MLTRPREALLVTRIALIVLGLGISCGCSHNNTITDAAEVAGVDATIACPANTPCLELLAGNLDNSGSVDGTGANALFFEPVGVASDHEGNVYVGDSANHTIRKITSAGVVTTLAGLAGNYGSADGAGSGAQFTYPAGVTVDHDGNVYVADSGNDTIRQVTPSGVVTTLAGLAGYVGAADGTRVEARFNAPLAVAVDGAGNVFVSDAFNCTIRKVTTSPPPAGVVTTLAGSPNGCCTSAGGLNCVGVDGIGSAARFVGPDGLAVDDAGNIYVADDNAIRKVTPAGVVTTLAGSKSSTSFGSADGTGSAASFGGTTGVAVDAQGDVYVADEFNGLIRKVTPEGVVTTIAGVCNPGGQFAGVCNSGSDILGPGGPTILGPLPSFTVLNYLAVSGSSLVIADAPSGYANTNAIVVLESVVPSVAVTTPH
jgi:sugar lactone lactonase YvrE